MSRLQSRTEVSPRKPKDATAPNKDRGAVKLPHLSEAERLTIRTLHLQGVPLQTIAKQLGRDRETISRCARRALDVLQGSEPQLARLWLKAARKAAEAGDHRPAKDALLHSKAIEPVGDSATGGWQVFVGVALPGMPGHAPQVVEGKVVNTDPNIVNIGALIRHKQTANVG